MGLDVDVNLAVSAGVEIDAASDAEAPSSQTAAQLAVDGQPPSDGGMPMGEPGQAPMDEGIPEEAAGLQASSSASISLTLLNRVITLLEEKLA